MTLNNPHGNRVSIPATKELKKQFPGYNVQDFEACYHSNGYDHEMLPIITNLQPTLIQPARWGYVPENAHSLEQLARYDTLNARAETLFSSQMYGEAARDRRCVIFVKGFFESKHEGKITYPHYISKEDGTTFTFGGIWSTWKGMLTCSIITVDANPLLAHIHNNKKRMPLILTEEQWPAWFNGQATQQEVEALMQPYPLEDLVAWQVNGIPNKRDAANTEDVQKAVGVKYKGSPFPELTPKQKPSKPKGEEPPQLGLF